MGIDSSWEKELELAGQFFGRRRGEAKHRYRCVRPTVSELKEYGKWMPQNSLR